MAAKKSLLYRLGYALERARLTSTSGRDRLAGLAERRRAGTKRTSEGGGASRSASGPLPDADALLLTAAAAGVTKVLDLWRPRRRAGAFGILRAALAGAGAALLVDLVRPLLRGEGAASGLDAGTPDRLLLGASQGILYGAAVEPRVPGPPPLKGALYGSVEYVVDPVGGLGRLLGPHAPHLRLPLLADLLDGLAPEDRVYLEHLIFGVALAALYGSAPSTNGYELTEAVE